MAKPFGVLYWTDGRRIRTESKDNFLALLDEVVQPMDVIGVYGGVKWYNPLTWLGRWIESETNSPISHVECVGERDASSNTATIYSTDFRFKHVPFKSELHGQQRIIIKRMPGLTQEQVAAGLTAMAGFVGDRYPAEELFEMKAQAVLAPAAYKLWINSREPICSQSISYTYDVEMKVPISPGLGRDWSRMTPIDIMSDDRMPVVGYWNWPLPEGQYLK